MKTNNKENIEFSRLSSELYILLSRHFELNLSCYKTRIILGELTEIEANKRIKQNDKILENHLSIFRDKIWKELPNMISLRDNYNKYYGCKEMEIDVRIHSNEENTLFLKSANNKESINE